MFGLSWREILLNLAAIILITCVASFLVWRKKLYLHMRNYCRAAQLRPRKSNRGIDDPAGANGLHSLYNHDANAVKAVNLNASDGQTAIVSNTDATNLNAFDRQTAIVATADASIPIVTRFLISLHKAMNVLSRNSFSAKTLITHNKKKLLRVKEIFSKLGNYLVSVRDFKS